MEAIGILERRQYSERRPRHEYHLTEAGRQLRPIVLALNAGFAPSAEQVEWAERTLAALAEGEREGRGAVALAGTMIDEPVAARARGILARTRREGA
jgi:DNA-binding MarR family transcriptional regulator